MGLHPLAWFVIFSTVLLRIGRFATMPFLSLILVNKGVSIGTIGLILSAGPAICIFASIYSGYLSDFLGRRFLTFGGLFLSSLCYLGFIYSENLWLLALLNMGLSMGSQISEPSFQLLLSDLHQKEDYKKAYSYRFMGINVGAAIAAFGGGYFAGISSSKIFFLAFFIYFLTGIACLFLKFPQATKTKERESFFTQIKVVIKDFLFIKILFLFISTSFFYQIFMVSTPLSLRYYFAPEASLQAQESLGARLREIYQGNMDVGIAFAFIMFVNGVSICLLQPLVNITFLKKSNQRAYFFGVLWITLGYLGFALGMGNLWLLTLATIFISLGECVISPALGSAIEDLAPPDKKGIYFGMMSFSRLGGSLAPLCLIFLDPLKPPYFWTLFVLVGCLILWGSQKLLSFSR